MRFLSYTGEVPRGQGRLATPETVSHQLLREMESRDGMGLLRASWTVLGGSGYDVVSGRTSVSLQP